MDEESNSAKSMEGLKNGKEKTQISCPWDWRCPHRVLKNKTMMEHFKYHDEEHQYQCPRCSFSSDDERYCHIHDREHETLEAEEDPDWTTEKREEEDARKKAQQEKARIRFMEYRTYAAEQKSAPIHTRGDSVPAQYLAAAPFSFSRYDSDGEEIPDGEEVDNNKEEEEKEKKEIKKEVKEEEKEVHIESGSPRELETEKQVKKERRIRIQMEKEKDKSKLVRDQGATGSAAMSGCASKKNNKEANRVATLESDLRVARSQLAAAEAAAAASAAAATAAAVAASAVAASSAEVVAERDQLKMKTHFLQQELEETHEDYRKKLQVQSRKLSEKRQAECKNDEQRNLAAAVRGGGMKVEVKEEETDADEHCGRCTVANVSGPTSDRKRRGAEDDCFIVFEKTRKVQQLQKVHPSGAARGTTSSSMIPKREVKEEEEPDELAEVKGGRR